MCSIFAAILLSSLSVSIVRRVVGTVSQGHNTARHTHTHTHIGHHDCPNTRMLQKSKTMVCGNKNPTVKLGVASLLRELYKANTCKYIFDYEILLTKHEASSSPHSNSQAKTTTYIKSKRFRYASASTFVLQLANSTYWEYGGVT